MKQIPWRVQEDDLILNCQIQPGARQDRIVGLHGYRLKIQLKAPPVDNKANASLIEFLARIFACPRARVHITRGLGSRQKTIQINSISGIPEEISKYAPV